MIHEKVSLKYVSSIYLLLIIFTLIPGPTDTIVSYTFNTGSIGEGVLHEIYKYMIKQKPYSYWLISHDNEIYSVYSSDLEITVFYKEVNWTINLIGYKYCFKIDNLLLITSIYQGIDIAVFNLDSKEYIVYGSIDIPVNLVLVKPLSIYYVPDSYIEIYIYSYDLTDKEYTVIIRVDLKTSSVYLVNIREDILCYSNTILYVDEENPIPSYRLLDTAVSLSYSNGYTLIAIGANTYYVEGKPYLDKPLAMVSNHILIFLNNNSVLRIIDYYDNSFSETELPFSINKYVLEKIYVTSTSLTILYSNDEEFLINYYSYDNYSIVKTLILNNIRNIIMTYMFFDNDALPDLITYLNHHLYIHTSSNSSWAIYWDYLRNIIINDNSIVIVNNTLYTGIIYENNTVYIYKVLKYVIGEKLDTTPPELFIHEPKQDNIYLNNIEINISAYDRDTSVYLIKASILNTSFSIIYQIISYGSRLYCRKELEPGHYMLFVEAWNIDGFSTHDMVEFYVVDRDILIIKPLNNSFVKDKIYLEIISYGEYLVDVIVNNTVNYTILLEQGLNNYVLNISGFSDGVLCVSLYVRDTRHNIILYLYKDTIPPILNVYGINNNTSVYNYLSFTIEAYDQNLDNISIYLNGTLVKTIYGSGTHNIVLDLVLYSSGYYVLDIYVFDKAGNNVSTTYLIYVVEIGDPLIIVTPEPLNNTFVDRVLRFNVSCYNVSRLDIIVNNSIIASYNISSLSTSISITINTSMWIDGVYLVVFNATGYRSKYYVLKYIWFIDNMKPYANMTVPLVIIQPTGIWRWRNNSFVPMLNPNTMDRFIIRYNNKYYFPLSIEVRDYWFENATLYINNSLAEYGVVYGGKVIEVKPAIFTKPGIHYIYVSVEREGYYIFRLEAFDKTGHVSIYVIGAWFDFNRPELTILSPVNGSVLRNIKLVFTVRDNFSHVFLVKFNIQLNQYVKPSLEDYMPFPYLYIGRVNETYNVSIPLVSEGTYYLSLLVFDSGLNYDIETIVFTIDRSLPEIMYNYSIRDNKLYLDINVSDNYGIYETYVYINDELVIVFNTTEYSLVREYGPGTYTVNITSIDLAGNVKTVVFDIKIPIPGTPIISRTSIESPIETTNEMEETSSKINETRPENHVIPIYLAVIVLIILLVIVIIMRKKR